MKKSGIGKSGLPAMMILLAGGLLLMGFMGCSDNGTTVKVETTPSAAKVFIDGKFVGLSPCECFIRDSQPEDLWEQHVIEVKAKGYETQSRRLRYRTGAAWLPDKIEFIMPPSIMLDEPIIPTRPLRVAKVDKPKPMPKPAPAPTPAPALKPEPPKTPEPPKAVAEKPKPASKTVSYTPAAAQRIKEFRSATPWSKAAPINDDNIPPAQTHKTKNVVKTKKERHAEMEKIVVSTKGSSIVTAPKRPEVTPARKEHVTKPAKIAAREPERETPGTIVPISRPRLAPLPKQVAVAEKPDKPQFIGSVPWKNVSEPSRQSEIELVSKPVDRHVTKTSSNGKNHSPAAPWVQAGGLGIQASAPEKTRLVHEPQDNRLFSCDLRIARVSDGVVLYQASGVDTYSNLDELAQDLVGELAAYVPDNSPVAIFCFHNRRNTESGRFVADKMLEATVNAVRKSHSLTYIKTVNIRDALNSEASLEQSKQLTKPRFYPLLKNAEYVIIGGVSLFDNFAAVATRPARQSTNDED